MRAMILAGGLSTRLYPLTKQVPKPLVPVGGVPNAVHLIRYLHAYGISEIAINVHYLPESIVAELGDGSRFGVRLEYLHEKVLLGSAGAVEQMRKFLDGDTFAVVGCDDLTDLRLDELLRFHEEAQAIATIGLVERDDVSQYGVVVTDAGGRITGFQEKPAQGTERSRLVNTGIYAFSPEIFDWIPPGEFYDFGKQVFPALQEACAPFFGFDARGAYWCDIGTPAEYRRASVDLLRGTLRIPGTRSTGADPSAQIASSAAVEGDVWIGAGARIGERARVAGPSVIGDGVRVGDGATVDASILWRGARVGDGAVVRESIVGIEYEIAPAAQLNGAVVANEPEPVP